MTKYLISAAVAAIKPGDCVVVDHGGYKAFVRGCEKLSGPNGRDREADSEDSDGNGGDTGGEGEGGEGDGGEGGADGGEGSGGEGDGGWLASFGPDDGYRAPGIADFAYEIADAMLVAREAPQWPPTKAKDST